MADVEKTVLIGHSAEQMFDLVTDVKDYPNFLPWCGGVEIYEQTETSLDARVDIAFKGIHQFTLATICHSVAENGSSLAVVSFQYKKVTEVFNYFPIRVVLTRSSVHLHLHLPSPFKVVQH